MERKIMKIWLVKDKGLVRTEALQQGGRGGVNTWV